MSLASAAARSRATSACCTPAGATPASATRSPTSCSTRPVRWPLAAGFVGTLAGTLVFLGAIAYLFTQGRRHLGHQHPGRLGLRDRQLRLVDRHRPRRHLHLGDPAAAAPALAHLDQPLRRGDDAVRRGMAGLFPILHLGRPWFFYWLAPYPEHDEPVAAVAQPAGVGLLRDRHLHHRVAPVLVPGPDARPRDAARPRRTAASSRSPTACSRSAGAARRGTGRATRSAYLLLAGLATPLVVSVHSRGLARLRDRQHARLPLDDLPALLRRRRAVLRLRHGADAGDPAAPRLRPARLHHRRAPRPRRQGAARHRRARRLRLRHRDLHRLLQRRRVRDRDDDGPLDRRLCAGLLVDAVLQRASRRRSCGGAGRGAASRCCSSLSLVDQPRHVDGARA